MIVDFYTKAVLSVIAICLLILTFVVLNNRNVMLVPEANAAQSIKCTGTLKANAWGGTEASIGGYSVEIICE